jgi:hypothetical protein
MTSTASWQGVVFRGAVGRKGGALGEYHARDGPHYRGGGGGEFRRFD